MQGLFKRKQSDIWQGRFRIPEQLWRERARLPELGVIEIGKNQEFAKSTGCGDRDDAVIQGCELRRRPIGGGGFLPGPGAMVLPCVYLWAEELEDCL